MSSKDIYQTVNINKVIDAVLNRIEAYYMIDTKIKYIVKKDVCNTLDVDCMVKGEDYD